MQTLAYRTFSGKRRDGQTVIGIIPQFDGSTHASTNCGPCSESKRLVSQQKGRRPAKGYPWQPTGASIRRETGDTSGGTTPGQTTTASYREYGIPHAAPRIGNWSEVEAKLWAGYAVDLLVGYGPINAVKSGSPGFTGNHRVLLVGIKGTSKTSADRQILSADPLYDGRRSGIPRGQQWLGYRVLKSAAGQLKIDGTRTLNTFAGTQKAYYIPSLTRTAPAVPHWATVPARSLWFYTVSGGVITGREARRTGGFSGSCTAPADYPWPGHGTYRLVRMTSGAYSGRYIAATFARAVS